LSFLGAKCAEYYQEINHNKELTKELIVVMKNPFTVATAKILLPFAKKIKKLEVLKKGKAAGSVMLLVYTVAGGATCFTFLSKQAFFTANREQRRAAIYDFEVEQIESDKYVVTESNGNSYVLYPKALDPSWRCLCSDVFYFGDKCKHQIAVEEFKKRRWGDGRMG